MQEQLSALREQLTESQAEVFLRVATTSKRAERKARRWVEKKCRLQRESRERAAKKYSFYMGCSS